MNAKCNTAITFLWYITASQHQLFSLGSGSEYGFHRTACRKDVLFKLTDRGKKLTGGANNIIQQRKEATLSSCVKACLGKDNCITINYKRPTEGSAAAENCQLLNISKSNGVMVESTGWNHYEPVKQVGPRCRFISCDPGMKCNETCGNLLGYECIDIDECLSRPCQNSGTCNNLSNKYSCQCSPGFEGTNCETDTNECASNPCQNGGTCADHINKYTCKCAAGYRGENCEHAGYRSCRQLYMAGNRSDTVYKISDTNGLPYQVYCDMSDKGWTLIARFSNADSKGWGENSGEYWYDTLELGNTTSPTANSDMINKAFYDVKGNDIKFSRSDQSSHPFLLYAGGCFSQTTFRSKITSYGNFRNNSQWLATNNTCKFSCGAQYYGSILGVAGFAQFRCSGDLKPGKSLNFWCHYDTGGGAVVMIGGGGSSCSGADHGIAITESDSPKFGDTFPRQDFGNESDSTPVTSYALNLWIR